MAKLKVCPTTPKSRVAEKLANRWWRLNNLYWILDDQGNKIKFKVNPIQRTLYLAAWWLNIILKSRQHGITTLICIYFLDACLFNSNVRAGIIAHKFKDAQRIFRDKIKFAYDNLPESIKVACPTIKDDACELILANNSSIYVGTSMRSGTLQYLHVSEYGPVCAHTPGKAREIKAGAMETVHEGGQIFIESTAEGMGNDFHKMCEIAHKAQLEGVKLTRMDYKFHFFSWYKKPQNILPPDDVNIPEELNKYFAKIEAVTGDRIGLPHRAWYTKKKQTLRSEIYKEHPSTPEEAFMASLEGAYFGHEMIKVKEDDRVGGYPWEKQIKVFTFWDLGSIHTAIWFWQFIHARVRAIECYYDATGQGIAYFAKMLQDKPYVYAQHWTGWDLDPESGSNRKNQVSGQFIKDEAEALGIKFNILPKYDFNDRIKAAQDVIEKTDFNKETTEIGVAALFNYRQSKDQARSTEDRTVFSKHPEPGPECHIADAFSHGAMAYMYHIVKDGQVIGFPYTLSASADHQDRDDSAWDYDPLHRDKRRA